MKTPVSGFTLIELLVVIAVIGILAAVLIPNLLAARDRAYDAAAASCAKQIATGQEILFIDNQAFAVDFGALDAAASGMVDTCEAVWVDDSTDFLSGWGVSHPNGSGIVYVVMPGGIVPPP